MASPSNEWSNEKILKFIKCLSSEPAIWDPNNKQHKLKHKVYDAWLRIEEAMNTPLEDLKSKKKSLMASFRPLVYKKRASLQPGVAEDEVYEPTWFAYSAMESFLGFLYGVDEPPNPEVKVKVEIIENENTPSGYETETTQDAYHENETPRTPVIPTPVSTPIVPKKRRLQYDVDDAHSRLNRSFQTLNDILNEKDDDECTLYGKLLASKLRKYPESTRQQLMYKIDGLLLENPPHGAYVSYNTATPSPSPVNSAAPSPSYAVSS